MFRLVSAIFALFALFTALAQAKHERIRIYAFTSADCNGPPIYGNIDFRRDKCMPIPFGASSLKIMEIKKGDWTKELNAGPTGCYFYSYTQFGCLERYLDTLVDPGDVISSCIPSRDANAPIFSVSYMCIRGAPPKRSLPPGPGNWTHDTNDTIQYADRKRPHWHTPIFVNQTAGLNETGRPGDNLTARHNGASIVLPKPEFNLTSKSNSTREVRRGEMTLPYGPRVANKQPNSNSTERTNNEYLTTRHHGPAFINGQPNFNSSKSKTAEGNLTVRHYGPAIAGGKLNFRSTPGSNKETSWNETQPAVNQAAEQDAAITNKTITIETVVAKPAAFKTVVIVPDVEERAVIEPAANKTVVPNSTEVDDSDSDSDSDSDDDSDPKLPAGNSTTLDKRAWTEWKGPRRGVWMLHPWTGSIICYECYSESEEHILIFQCQYSAQFPTDCGERPLAPVYTKTVSIQPVVTVSPGDGAPLVKRGAWKRRVYMQNPWYPGTTICATAKWKGRNKSMGQRIKISHAHKKLRKCDKSPEAQNIAIYIRTATTTEPVRTVSLVDVRDVNSPQPVPATVSSSSSSSTSKSSSALATTVVATNVPVVVMSSVTVVQPTSSSSSSSSSASKPSSSPSLSIIKFTIPTATSTAVATKTLVLPAASQSTFATGTVKDQQFRTIVILPDSTNKK